MTLFGGSGSISRAWGAERGGAKRQDAIACEPGRRKAREAGGATAGERGAKFAPVPERGKELRGARDEIAARAQAAAQPNAGNGAQANAQVTAHMTTTGTGFARRQELRCADDDDVAHRALDLIEADPGAAALAIAAA